MAGQLDTLKQKHQRLTDFIRHLSKKEYAKCNKLAQKMQISLANQAKTCIQNVVVIDTLAKDKNDCLQDTKRLKEKLTKINEENQKMKSIKGFKLTEHQKQLSNHLIVFDFVKKGYYSQASRNSTVKYPFIDELIEYRQLKRILQNSQQMGDFIYGGKQYRKMKEIIRKVIDKNLELGNQIYQYILRMDGISNEDQWERPQLMQPSIYQQMQRIQFKLRCLMHQNRELRQRINQNEQQQRQIPIQQNQMLSSRKSSTVVIPQFPSHLSDRYEKISSRIKHVSKLVCQQNQHGLDNVDKRIDAIQAQIRRLQQMNSIYNRKIKMTESSLQQGFIIESLQLRVLELQKYQKYNKEKLFSIFDKIAPLVHHSSTKLLKRDQKDVSNIYSAIQNNLEVALVQMNQRNGHLQSIIRQRNNYKNNLNKYTLEQSISQQQLQLNQELVLLHLEEDPSDVNINMEQLKLTLKSLEQKNESLDLALKQQQQKMTKLQQEIKKKQAQIKQLRNEIHSYQKDRSALKNTLKRQTSKYKQLEQSIVPSKIFVQSKSNSRDEVDLQGSNRQSSLGGSIKQQPLFDQAKYYQVKEQLEQLTNKYNDLIKQKQNISNKYSQLEVKAKHDENIYKQKVKQMTVQNKELTRKLEKEKQINEEQIQQISQLNTMLEELQQYQLEDRKELAKTAPNQSSIIISEAIKISCNYEKQTQLQQLQNKFKQSQEQIKKVRERVKKLQRDNLALHKDVNRKEKDAKYVQAKYQKIKEVLTNSQALLQTKERQIQIFKKQLQRLKLDQQRYKEKPNKVINNNVNMAQRHRCLTHLFTAKEVFEEGQQQRLHLIKVLQQEIGAIYQTKLLYSYDPLNRVNFHRYIDNHKNLIVIIKTSIGKLIAGYSSSQLSVEGGVRGKGLLIPLWDLNSVFHLIPGRRPVSYDDYFLIYGNSQLRIRSQQNKLFSNFGISNAYFDNNHKKVDDLLGESDREIDLDTYQVYEIIFERDID